VSERDAELLERWGLPERDAKCLLRATGSPGALATRASASAPALDKWALPRMPRRYQTLRSVSDNHVHLICRDGEFEHCPITSGIRGPGK
jgi:hypothetical protein